MDQDKDFEKIDYFEKTKEGQYNIPKNAVEALLENVLNGKTVVLPSEVFRSISKEPLSLSLAHSGEPSKRRLKPGDEDKTVDFSKQNLPNEGHASNNCDLASQMHDVNNPKEKYSIFMLKDTLVEIVQNDSSEGRTTRPVTPTGMQPVSEQYIQAKRILNSNPYGVEPPIFQNLPAEFEEAFTVSAAYVAQLIISSTAQLNYKLEKIAKSLPIPAAVNDPNVNANVPETNSSISDTRTTVVKKDASAPPIENAANNNNNVLKGNSPNKQSKNNEVENRPPIAKAAPVDVFASFESYLLRIKMPVPEVTAHLNHARILSKKEAVKYMSKFGFTPKKKK